MARRAGVWTAPGKHVATRTAVVAIRPDSMIDLFHGWIYCTLHILNRVPCRNREMHPGKRLEAVMYRCSRTDGHSICT